MRRNILSLLKFALLCVCTIALTAFLYKTLHVVQRIHGDGRGAVDPTESSRLRAHPHEGAFFMGQKKNVAKRRVDWHDYGYIDYEKTRAGIGEHGTAAHTTLEEEDERKRLFDQNGFNALLSDQIALNRSIADIRHKE